MYAFMQEMFLGSFSVRFFAVNLVVMHDYIDLARNQEAAYPLPDFRRPRSAECRTPHLSTTAQQDPGRDRSGTAEIHR